MYPRVDRCKSIQVITSRLTLSLVETDTKTCVLMLAESSASIQYRLSKHSKRTRITQRNGKTRRKIRA